MQFVLDLNITTVLLTGTNFDGGPALIWSADNLGDGDHQLWVLVNSFEENGSLAVDYLEYVIPLPHFVTKIAFQQYFCFQG